MGNDGGTIAKGKDLRALFGKSESNKELLQPAEIACALTSLPLSKKGASLRVVGDYQGQLFLKERLLEAILSKTLKRTSFLYIRSLKDLVDVHPKFDLQDSLVCPISDTKRTKHVSFCYLRTCGCVFAAKVLQDFRSHLNIGEKTEMAAEAECPVCSRMFMFNYDIVRIPFGDETETKAFNERNYKYLVETLHLSHDKSERKRKREEKLTKDKRMRVGETSGTLEKDQKNEDKNGEKGDNDTETKSKSSEMKSK